MSGYARATFGALRDSGAEVLLVHEQAAADAPFDDDLLDLGLPGGTWAGAPDECGVLALVTDFAPHALLVSSWNPPQYRHVSLAMRGCTLRVLCMDNAWLGSAKQWGARAIATRYVQPAYDVAFLPGERQATFARMLGFPDDRILWGLYTCDHQAFTAARRAGGEDAPNSFLFAGRLVREKGVDVLAEAYRSYRGSTPDPWPLIVSGTGPLAKTLDSAPGVEMAGFVPPHELPALFSRSGCLVLPSRFEPWGVVVHEATSAGLAVICSSACGSSTRLVLDGYNGAVVRPGDPISLTEAMRWMSAPTTDRAELARHSFELSHQFTPERWATYLIERIPPLRRSIGLAPV